jgi:hypothetical protein
LLAQGRRRSAPRRGHRSAVRSLAPLARPRSASLAHAPTGPAHQRTQASCLARPPASLARQPSLARQHRSPASLRSAHLARVLPPRHLSLALIARVHA